MKAYINCTDLGTRDCCSSCHEDYECYGSQYPLWEDDGEINGVKYRVMLCCRGQEDWKVLSDIEKLKLINNFREKLGEEE